MYAYLFTFFLKYRCEWSDVDVGSKFDDERKVASDGLFVVYYLTQNEWNTFIDQWEFITICMQ